ncbi:MAG: S9 family peptidase [Clostridia bacterium]|nr:S9 family peptidase [Clostridia bacterium]
MRGFAPEDYGRLTRFSSLASSPDGAVACVQYFWENDCWRRRVTLIFRGEAREITLGGSREIGPVFSRTGCLLWFLSDGRIALHDRQTGETREAFPLPQGVEAVDVLPLAAGCLFVCRKEIRETPPAGCDWEMPLVAESLRYRSDADHGFTKTYHYQLCRFDGEIRVLKESEQPFSALAVLPDESAALFAQGSFRWLRLSDGEERAVSPALQAAGDIRPCVSPDGRYALAAVRTAGMEIALARLWLDGQEHPRDEIENEPAGLTEGAYMDASPERKTLIAPALRRDTWFVSACRDHRPMLWRVTVTEGKLRYEACDVPGVVTEAAAETAGGVPVLLGDHSRPPAPALVQDGALAPLLPGVNAWYDRAEAAPYTLLSAPSQDGRAELTGYMLFPGDQQETYPLLVWVHGGPAGCWAPGFNLEIQCAVSRGYAVLLPNPRGSTGRGNAYADPEHAFDGGAANDILTLLGAALRRFPCLDSSRVGILGGSYGGYMAAWMAGKTRRFRAAVVVKAVTNWLFIHFKSAQAGQPIFDDYRDFQDFLVDTVKQSPVYFAQDVAIPTLIIHGEKDQQVPAENAHQYYTALKDCHPDLPVKLMLLPDCCHGYSRDALPDYIAIQREALSWLDRYVKEEGHAL